MKSIISIVKIFLLVKLDNTFAVHFDEPRQPDFIVVAARQRSGSSTLSSAIGGHPCAVNANEIWTDQKSQDILGGHQYTNLSSKEIREYPRDFLHQVHWDICRTAREYGNIHATCTKCTIVLKMFDIHSVSFEGIEDMMSDKDIDFVVLERDVQDEFCSLQVAHKKGDWGTTPGQHKNGFSFECGEVTDEFYFEHSHWFKFLRTTLRKKERVFLDVPFSAMTSCEIKNVVQDVFAFGGLQTPINFDYSDKNIENLFNMC